MTLNEKFRAALGLAMRAGKCPSGDFVSEKLVRRGKARLVLIDTGASEATKERYRGMCLRAGTDLLEVENMGGAIGKPGRMIAAVTDGGFAEMIKKAYGAAHTQIDTGVEGWQKQK